MSLITKNAIHPKTLFVFTIFPDFQQNDLLLRAHILKRAFV